MDDLLARHAKERKELQGRITSKKKNATKKTRKGVNDECDKLEYDLKEKQSSEIEALAPSSKLEDGLTEEIGVLNVSEQQQSHESRKDTVQINESTSIATSATSNVGTTNGRAEAGKKPNRQQARKARKAAEVEAQMEEAEREAANMPDKRDIELNSMKDQLKSRGLTEIMIRPDGHCLYSACAKTIPATNGKDYKTIRESAATYIDAHSDDFAPFMEEPVASYTHKIRDTAEWGGHLELQAIAKAFGVRVNVLHASGQVNQISSEHEPSSDIWLAYYEHSFGLGEHYNALQKAAG